MEFEKLEVPLEKNEWEKEISDSMETGDTAEFKLQDFMEDKEITPALIEWLKENAYMIREKKGDLVFMYALPGSHVQVYCIGKCPSEKVEFIFKIAWKTDSRFLCIKAK